MTISSASKSPQISVIVPVYNVEYYLERCINSIINQTYSNIEIILVNDGSTDDSLIICRAYESMYKNICVVDKENGGLSSARNAGLEIANGDFITFIDSDDWIALDTYQYCLNLMDEYNADLIEFNYIMVKDGSRILNRPEENRIYDGMDILQYYMESTTKTGSYSVCRCLFPRHAVENIRFRDGKINEDIDFKYQAFSNCTRLVTSNQYKYYYYQSGNSLSTGGLKRRDFDLYEAADSLYELSKDESYGSIARLGLVKKSRTPFSLLSKIAFYGISDPDIDRKSTIEQLLKEHRKCVWILLSAPLPTSRRMLAVLFAINYRFTEILIKLYREYIYR